MKDIKDYLHLYLGQDFVFCIKNDEEQYGYSGDMTLTVDALAAIVKEKLKAKLILRPLSDMTSEEWGHMGKYGVARIIRSGDLWQSNAMETAYLLKQGFDLFNLIPEGLAIDKTTPTKTENHHA